MEVIRCPLQPSSTHHSHSRCSKIKSITTWTGLSRMQMEGDRCQTNNWIRLSSIWSSMDKRAYSSRTWTVCRNRDKGTKTSTTQLDNKTWCLTISMSIASPKSLLIGSSKTNSPLSADKAWWIRRLAMGSSTRATKRAKIDPIGAPSIGTSPMEVSLRRSAQAATTSSKSQVQQTCSK